jgi:hypothetical protein
MATVRSVDFLPEIFQTDANKQFLRATLDQLIQEPKFKKTQGFIGRTVGPGVNPNDKYVVEPTDTRANYQLEPGVVSLIPDTDTIQNAITYPGLNDAIGFQGGNSGRPDRLYESEYYSWDPFVDFDSFVNFSQYFWLPNGPEVVDVAATGVATSDNFIVNRENGVYTFSGVAGENPIIELVRGGSYTFQVAQNNKETVNYRVRNQGISSYVIDFQNNPTLTLSRGNTYVFNLTLNGDFPFWIKTAPVTGLGSPYNSGVSRNGAVTGLVTFTVPQDAPDTLYYISQTQSNMQGVLNIVDGAPGTGPGFWIQAAPGVSGLMPTTPNISSRDVFGVTGNGEDLGTIVFNVPSKTAQSFYYDLNPITSIDLITDLKFDEINNHPVDQFILQYGGIDGITNLNGRTLIFTNPLTDDTDGGWLRTTLFDPLEPGAANNGLAGSFDSLPYDQTLIIAPDQRYQRWQISYINVAGTNYLNCSKIADIAPLDKFNIGYGNTYSNTQWYKDATGTFKQIPLLTAVQDTLYYQDGTDPEIFGAIKLLEQTGASTLFVDQILGRKTYTSPNGVAFSNGLKVRFTGDVVPASYGSGTTSITYTETEPGTNYITSNNSNNLYVGEQIVFNSPSLGGLLPGQTYYVRSIAASGLKFTVSTVEGGPAVSLLSGTGTAFATSISNVEYYVNGVGTSIELLPVRDFTTPETYVVDAFDSTIATEPDQLDYLTISRASKDLNAWTRSNRWFHIDVINATADYNNSVAVLDNNYRAKRPIIQFRPGIRLWNMGTSGKAPVDIIDFDETDAFSNIEGSTSYSTDGYTFVEGTRVIFAADTDADVRDKIYIVSFVTPDTVDPLIAQPIIVLTLAADGVISLDQSTVCLYGNSLQGLTFWYDGTEWTQAQQKTGVQQAPLFNVYDPQSVSFGDGTKYQSTTFVGSKLFSYAVGDSSILDPVLQFPLQYLNINNVGDIVFVNNLYNDTFLYVVDNVSVTSDISSGSVREYTTRETYQKLLGWQTAISDSKVYQQFKFSYSGTTLKLDVPVLNQVTSAVPVIKIYVGSEFQDSGTYTYITTSDSTTITLNSTYVLGDIIEVLALSNQTSQVAFYQVPNNLESNPLNANSPSFTLGTIRQHYQSICENLLTLRGPVNGANNTRDLGDIIPYGLTILQQSSPMTLAGYFMRSQDYNIFAALQYNSQEYLKFKAQMLDSVLSQNIGFNSTAQILDTAIQNITLGKLDSQPFYWSDMIPQGVTTYSNSYTVSFITRPTFDTVQVYNFESANYLGLCVYINNEILVRGVDYDVATDGPRLTITRTLNLGDVVLINEYLETYGAFVPNTPTKMGLYPAYIPVISDQVTSTGTETVIIGHDGSVTKAFGDLRDEVLLEFEKRVYSNLKLDGNPVPLTIEEVLPGQFRETGFTFEEINTIFAQDLLSYCGWNKLDYKTQTFSANNEFTWNYSTATNKLNNQNLLGAWRGIYRYFYDTQQPSLSPWEMLGLAEKPLWWESQYGTAPYTSDNLVLWDDLEAGYVADPVSPYYRPEYARPGLTKVIPVNDQGELVSPFVSVVSNYQESQFQKSWAIGDGGPVEASWWNSSAYPFSVMHVLAVTRPAKFFALFADRDRYKYNEDYQQYLYDNRYRLDANGVQVYGNGVSKASFMDWIVDYNRQTGINSTDALQADLKSLDVRLCYRMASFSDKQYIKLYTEKSSPNSTNTALQIPDESYNVLLYKNQPFDRVIYSSVAVQKVAGGYAVFGYGNSQPYFNILESKAVGKLQTITTSGITIKVPTFYTNNVVQVPYGFIFSNATSVADFLLSYGQFLQRQGLSFTNIANGYVLDWGRMVNEFLYWTAQGWGEDAIINLNPLAEGLDITRPQAIVDSVNAETTENLILDQNSREISSRNLNVVRLGNYFSIQPLSTQSLSYIDLRYTNYEHMIVLDNQSVFGDLIYDPITGARQSRLNLIAATSDEWNGSVDAPGFILNQDNVEEWTGLRTYSKGEIVKYKNVYWSALTIVQPTDKFDFNVWTQSDFTQTEIGLLPNLANKANQLANSYDINQANLEGDNDLLSYGLTGFRPRQYMSALNLDDVSQLNVYRQFIGDKGSVLSAELFKSANLGKESADYDIFENWAVQRAVYGANANRSFFELRLNRALLNPNPSLIQVVLPQQQSSADQQILLSAVWRQSYKLTSPDILPTTIELPTDIGLPTAGYVNLDDADITVFDINDPSSLNANIDNIEVGTGIWVAKVNSYDWNIYRAQAVPGVIQHVCDNLNGTSRVIFSQNHGLVAGNKLIIKFFDTEINGVYQVLSVSNLTTVNISFRFTGSRTVANGSGLGYTLQTMRVSQASDVVNLPYANNILPGGKVWVDDNGQGLWEVLEKNEVFSDVTSLSPILLDAGEQYGSSVAQAQNRLAALVGSPRYGFGNVSDPELAQGALYLYVKAYTDQYQPVTPLGNTDAVFKLDATGIRGYGNAVDFGNQAWAIAGASNSTDQLSMSIIAASGNGSTVTVTFPTMTSTPFSIGDSVVITGVDPDSYNGTWTLTNCTASQLQFASTNTNIYLSGGKITQNSNYSTQVGTACIIYRDPALGQPGAVPFAQWQLLTPPAVTSPFGAPGTREFGYSVAMSLDERWAYVGSPATNEVHAYGLVDYENQFARARGDGVTKTYNIADRIQINASTQLKVTIDGTIQTLGTNYTVAASLGSVTFTTAPPADTLIDIQRIFTQQLDAQNYYDVTQSATSGSGTGAKFTIVRVRGQVGQTPGGEGSVGTTSLGLGYAVGNTVTIAASTFGGGVDGTNDIVLTVLTVGTGGALGLFSIAYTAPTLTSTFSLNEYFFTATTINSFSVTVDDALQRPNLDYTFNTTTDDLRFENVPPAGSVIIVNAQGYFEYVSTIDTSDVPGGLTAGDRFGENIAITTDGRQLMVGAPDSGINGETESGAVYIFDRNVQKFIYNSDNSTISGYEFTLLGTPVGPISVIVNNVFLQDQTTTLPNIPNTFTWNGANTVTINADLQTGDIVEIETNQFRFVQRVDQETAAEFSNFGQAVDICPYNCSLYVGEPNSSVQVFKGGIVERNVNQSRIYGTTTATTANPTLAAGSTIRVNDMDVLVPGSWSSASTYPVNTVVTNTVGSTTTIYLSLQAVPALTLITNTSYWQTVTSTTVLASVNVRALAAQINVSVPNVNATVDVNGYMTIAVKNNDAAAEFNKVQVAPGSALGTSFNNLGFETFVWTQNILSPYPVDYAQFGGSVSIDDSAVNLVVGAPNGTLYLETVFDDGTTFFDAGSTIFFTIIVQSGAAYTFDYLPSSSLVITNPGKFVFGQQVSNSEVQSLDSFGVAVNYTGGVLMVGAPKNDVGDSTSAFGAVFVFENPNRLPAWTIQTIEQPVVDVRLLNSVFLYDRISSAVTEHLDWLNPLQGKILGAARQNIDYIGAVDPASYNVGPLNVRGTTWVGGHLGEIWWDTSSVRFIDPNQDDITYASRRWSQVFPGSEIDVYQWIVSSVPPAQYIGEGVVKDTVSYVVNSRLTKDGTIATDYYFWVRGITVTATALGKTLPASTVANYIENPRASGIPYVAPINASTIAIYNSGDYIEAQDTIIHIEFDRELTNDNVHVEYELIPQDRADGFLSGNLYRKLQDSFCGVDSFGNLVPDPNLSIAERYGVQFRPRQSMFVDRFAALKNYLSRCNAVLSQYTISESRSFNLLNSAEPEPGSSTGLWNLRVANLEILGFQNIYTVPLGYRYLVVTDSSNRGLWTIYTVENSDQVPGERVLILTRVQGYNTPDYWSYIDWYRPGYNSSTKVITEVPVYSSLTTLEVAVGSSVKVTANAQGKWEIYLRTDLGYERVGLQDGTIEFSAELYDYALGRFGFDVEVFDAQYYDQEPVIETRKVIQAINEELFVDDLAIQRNKALVLMFNFVLSEFSAPEWLVKTSLIDVDHRIRDLVPYQNYVRDNQEFVSDYIQEVKPYHVSVREFNLKYTGFDEFFGDMSDFDVPAYYDTSLEVPQYVSPILLPYYHSESFNAAFNTKSDVAASSTVWTTWPWSQWYTNYLLTLDDIRMIEFGVGYTEPPQVVITGSATVPATAVAVINSVGQVVAINIVDAGSGYNATPTVTFNGGNGSGAKAYPIMNYDAATDTPTGLVRSFKTVIKYDRFQYVSSVLTWSPDGTYQDGTLVRYEDRVWQASSPDSTAVIGPDFNLEDWTPVNAGTYNNGLGLTGVDRTMGLYVAGVNNPGLELPLLIDGVDYPGVQVYGDYFLGDPTFVDAEYTSKFTDTTLGDRFSDINADGGQFIGPYEGHAPEELVNGSEYDTLDFRVYTRPGSDWSFDGHGFQLGSRRFIFTPALTSTFSWADVVDRPVEIVVSNQTQGIDLRKNIDYSVDYNEQTITINTGVADGEIINITVYELGGGSQLFRNNYNGGDVGDSVAIPVNSVEITDIAVFSNGELTTGVSWEPYVDSVPWDIVDPYSKFDTVKSTAAFAGSVTGTTLTVTAVTSGTVIAGQFITGEYVEPNTFVVDQIEPLLFGETLGGIGRYNVTVSQTGFPGNVVGASFYRALQNVPAGTNITETLYWFKFVPTLQTLVNFGTTYTGAEGLALVAFSLTTVGAGNFAVGNTYTIASLGTTNFTAIGAASNTVGTQFTATGVGTGSGTATYDYSWSTPQVQYFVVDNNTVSTKTFILTNSLQGSNNANMIVTRNGLRLRPYEGIEWFGDGSSTEFGLPQRGGFGQDIIDAPNDIFVWVDNVLQPQSFGAQSGTYSVSNYTGSNTPGRQVVFNDPLPAGVRILISVDTQADYTIINNQLQIITSVNVGDSIAVTTWNDTAQQAPLTLVFQGPIVTGVTVAEGYDSTVFDAAAISGTPGSFDFSTGTAVANNDFWLERSGVEASRLWVTLDGQRLFEGQDFVVAGEYLELSSGAIGTLQILAVTEFTSSLVPEAMAFRIFQDMRGVQATYRITAATSTLVAQPIGQTDSVIYVDDVRKLSEPALDVGIFGVVTINGERIMYRTVNYNNNSITGLLRGTAGTAAADHDVGTDVYDTGRGNLLPEQYQDYVVKDNSMGDGTTTVFYAPSIVFEDFLDSSSERPAIEVYVGGTRQYAYSDTSATSKYRYFVTDFDPLAVDFVVDNNVIPPLTAPAAGEEVTILVRQGTSWYQPGLTTASDGIALQDTETFQARFLRGL